MADDEDNAKKEVMISEEDWQVEKLRQGISQKFVLIQHRMEKQTLRLKALQTQLEQQLAEKSGSDHWLAYLKMHLHTFWWHLRHR